MTGPFYQDDLVTLYHGDCLEVTAELPDDSIDAVVTDPPYGLEFMGKDWDAPWKSAIEYGRGGAASVAFQQWCEQWASECLRVLKPGGHLLAFGGSRTWHRLAAAVEDAGFEVRDSIAWLYGSGFPKSLDVSKAIDKRPGVGRHREFAQHLAERRTLAGLSRSEVSERVVGSRSGACWNWEHHQFPESKWWPALRDLLGMDGDVWDQVISEAERETVGRRATGVGTGRGAISVIGDSGNYDLTAPATEAAKQWEGWGTALKPAFEPIVVGRKPLAGTVAANVLVHGTGALNINGCRVGADTSRGDRYRGKPSDGAKCLNPGAEVWDRIKHREPWAVPAGRWPTNVVLDESMAAELDGQTAGLKAGGAIAKGSKGAGAPRNNVIFGSDDKDRGEWSPYGDSGGASRFFPVFRYEAKASSSERPSADGVAHPTVKPIDLMRWLVRLVTPPNGVVLDPFAGSGTTAEACIHEHMRCITIEREAEYLPLIVDRLSKPIAVGFDFGGAS